MAGQYGVIGRKVLDYVDRFAPQYVFESFYNTLERVMIAPYPGNDPELRVMELKESTMRNAFTVLIADGLFVYQVMKDYPLIRLVDVVWTDEPTD